MSLLNEFFSMNCLVRMVGLIGLIDGFSISIHKSFLLNASTLYPRSFTPYPMETRQQGQRRQRRLRFLLFLLAFVFCSLLSSFVVDPPFLLSPFCPTKGDKVEDKAAGAAIMKGDKAGNKAANAFSLLSGSPTLRFKNTYIADAVWRT